MEGACNMLLFRVVDEDFPAPSALLPPRGNEEFPQSGREEASLRTEARRLCSDLLVVIGILLLEDFEHPRPRCSLIASGPRSFPSCQGH